MQSGQERRNAGLPRAVVGHFADVDTEVGAAVQEVDERLRAANFKVAGEEHAELVAASAVAPQEDDLRAVVVLVGREAARRMKPTPRRPAEYADIAARRDRDGYAGISGRMDELGRQTPRTALGGRKKVVGENQLADADGCKEGGDRGEVIRIGVGDDHRVEMPNARLRQRRQKDRPAGAVHRARAGIDDDARRAASNEIGRTVAHRKHGDLDVWLVGVRWREPLMGDRHSDRNRPHDRQERAGEPGAVSASGAAPPHRQKSSNDAPGPIRPKWRKELAGCRGAALGDANKRDGQCAGQRSERRSDRGREKRRGDRRISRDEDQATQRNRDDRERHGKGCDSPKVPDGDGGRDQPDGERRRQQRAESAHERGEHPIVDRGRSIPTLMERWRDMAKGEDRAKCELESRAQNLKRIREENDDCGESQETARAPPTTRDHAGADGQRADRGARDRRLRLDKEGVRPDQEE